MGKESATIAPRVFLLCIRFPVRLSVEAPHDAHDAHLRGTASARRRLRSYR
jgi:hypothetical protein